VPPKSWVAGSDVCAVQQLFSCWGPPRRGVAWRSALAALVLVGSAGVARAQALEPKHVLVIVGPTVGSGTAADLERETRAALSTLASVEVLPAPPLDLEAVQLALDCTDESTSCLSAVARKLQAQVLVVPSVKRHGSAVVLRLLRYDAGGGGEPRSLNREQPGRKLADAQLAALGEMTTELFASDEAARKAAEVAPPEAQAPETEPTSEPSSSSSPPAATHGNDAGKPLPLPPLIIGAAGIATVVAGVAVFAAMKSTEHDYAAQPVTNAMQAQAAEHNRTLGHREAVEASVLIGVGSAAIVAAGIWLAVDLSSKQKPTQTALLPWVGPRAAGLALSGALETRQ
jgi:hypothetical protein